MPFIQDVAKENDRVNYLLVVIDVVSKYAYVRPMKNKIIHILLEAFDSILSEGTKPEKLRTDKGTEFLNKSFRQYLKKKDIQFCTANNKPKASVVDRVNRTLFNLNFIVISQQSILYVTSMFCKTWLTLTITSITEV